MLNEFLVLGQIPGTNLDITFNELMIVLDLIPLFWLLHLNRLSLDQIKRTPQILAIYLSTRKGHQLKLRV